MNWAYNLDSGKVNAVMFLDLKKAFDTVDHEILSDKLKVNEVHGIAGHWFRSYLNNRKQRCYAMSISPPITFRDTRLHFNNALCFFIHSFKIFTVTFKE